MSLGRDLKKKKSSKEFEISRSTVWKIVYKWRTFKTAASMERSGRPSNFTPRADREMLKVATKNPKMSLRDLQQALPCLYDQKTQVQLSWEVCEEETFAR